MGYGLSISLQWAGSSQARLTGSEKVNALSTSSTMVVLGLNFSVVCTGFLEEPLGSHDTPGLKLHTVQNHHHLHTSATI